MAGFLFILDDFACPFGAVRLELLIKMFENRRHFRLREFIDVAWKVTGQDVSGEGLVVNISTSGLLLNTDRVFRPTDDCVLSIESATENLPFAAKKGKLMWFRRIGTTQERYQCGLEFLPDKKDSDFQEWFEKKVNQLSEAGDVKILANMAF